MSKKVLIIITLCIILVLVLGWVFIVPKEKSLTPEEKKQAMEEILGREARGETIVIEGENSFAGKYFTLSYPAYARLYEKENPNITNNPNLLEFLRLDSNNPKFRFVAMVGKADSVADLDELSGVRVRQDNDLYKREEFELNGSEGVLFVKEADRIERASFFLTDNISYSFVITGVDRREIERIYSDIISSVEF